MKKEVDFYQEYLVGIQLPEGIPPPMLGYSHRDLVIAATKRVAVFLEQENIQDALARETMTALAEYIRVKFEEEVAEYQIATWWKKSYKDPSARIRAINRLAEDLGGAAVDAASDSLAGSPLLQEGRDFYGKLIGRAGEGVRDHILSLNKK